MAQVENDPVSHVLADSPVHEDLLTGNQGQERIGKPQRNNDASKRVTRGLGPRRRHPISSSEDSRVIPIAEIDSSRQVPFPDGAAFDPAYSRLDAETADESPGGDQDAGERRADSVKLHKVSNSYERKPLPPLERIEPVRIPTTKTFLQTHRDTCEIAGLATTLVTFEGIDSPTMSELYNLLDHKWGEGVPRDEIIKFLCSRGYDVVRIGGQDEAQLKTRGKDYLTELYNVKDAKNCTWDPVSFHETVTASYITDQIRIEREMRKYAEENQNYQEIHTNPDASDIFTLLSSGYLVWTIELIPDKIRTHRRIITGMHVQPAMFFRPSELMVNVYDPSIHGLYEDYFSNFSRTWLNTEPIYGVKRKKDYI